MCSSASIARQSVAMAGTGSSSEGDPANVDRVSFIPEHRSVIEEIEDLKQENEVLRNRVEELEKGKAADASKIAILKTQVAVINKKGYEIKVCILPLS